MHSGEQEPAPKSIRDDESLITDMICYVRINLSKYELLVV